MEIEYDIFISFKNSDEEGNPTKDKELAHKLYAFLQSKNLQVFFSDATLQELGTDSWSKEIQRALKVSKIFIALGSKEEYFYSYWLQRERTTFLTRKEDDKSKALYSYIAPPMTTAKLPKDIEDFECFEDTKPNEFDRLYSFISNHLARYFQRIKDDEFLDKDLANPYKGLFHFTYEDRDNYFGREKESKEIAQIVKESRFFTLLGASGSGKSSLLFAGILPLIKEKSVDILDFRPQDRPFRNLANIFIKALYPDKLMQIEKKEELTNKLLDGTIKLDNLTELYFENQKIEKLYIIIDQFEELFTLNKDSKIKNLFLDQLLQLVKSNLNVTLIISLRADFLSFASYYEPFNQTINQNPKTILGLMSEENLKRAIELPAKNLGVRFEKGLIERILEEISKEAGQLPLLEFALEQFWQKMSSRVITHKSLDEMGSISHAISYHADRVYEKYPNKEAVRRIFLKLVNSGSGTEDTRRVAKFEDFDKSDRDTITLLATDRLVITTENSVEVVHEALIREWSVLKAWIEENREFLEWEKRTRIDLEFYKENGEREEDLLRDGKLLRAKEFLESYEREVSGEFRGFIERSVEVQKRRERRKRAVLGGVFVFLLIIIGVIGYFWNKATNLNKKIEKQSIELIIKQQGMKNLTELTVTYISNKDEKFISEYIEFIVSSKHKKVYMSLLSDLVEKTDSIDEDERQYWRDIFATMTTEQIIKLSKILFKEKMELKKLEKKYESEIIELNKKYINEKENDNNFSKKVSTKQEYQNQFKGYLQTYKNFLSNDDNNSALKISKEYLAIEENNLKKAIKIPYIYVIPRDFNDSFFPERIRQLILDKKRDRDIEFYSEVSLFEYITTSGLSDIEKNAIRLEFREEFKFRTLNRLLIITRNLLKLKESNAIELITKGDVYLKELIDYSKDSNTLTNRYLVAIYFYFKAKENYFSKIESYNKCVSNQEEFIKYLDFIKNKIDKDITDNIVSQYGNLTWYYLWNNQAKKSSEVGEMLYSIYLKPNQEIWIKGNIVIAYLFMDDFEKALKLFMEIADKKANEDTMKSVIIKDLKEFESKNISTKTSKKFLKFIEKQGMK